MENETRWNCSRHGEIRKGRGNCGTLGEDWKETKKLILKNMVVRARLLQLGRQRRLRRRSGSNMHDKGIQTGREIGKATALSWNQKPKLILACYCCLNSCTHENHKPRRWLTEVRPYLSHVNFKCAHATK